MRSTTLRMLRWVMVVAGAVNLWTVASARYLAIQIGAGAMAAIMFGAAGLLWERYAMPTFADDLAQHLFGAKTASEGLIMAAGKLVQQQPEGADEEPK